MVAEVVAVVLVVVAAAAAVVVVVDLAHARDFHDCVVIVEEREYVLILVMHL